MCTHPRRDNVPLWTNLCALFRGDGLLRCVQWRLLPWGGKTIGGRLWHVGCAVLGAAVQYSAFWVSSVHWCSFSFDAFVSLVWIAARGSFFMAVFAASRPILSGNSDTTSCACSVYQVLWRTGSVRCSMTSRSLPYLFFTTFISGSSAPWCSADMSNHWISLLFLVAELAKCSFFRFGVGVFPNIMVCRNRFFMRSLCADQSASFYYFHCGLVCTVLFSCAFQGGLGVNPAYCGVTHWCVCHDFRYTFPFHCFFFCYYQCFSGYLLLVLFAFFQWHGTAIYTPKLSLKRVIG